MTRVFLLLLHDDLRNKGSLEDGSLWGLSDERKLCTWSQSQPSVDGCGLDFREDEKQFVIVNWRQVSHMPFIGWCSRKRVTWPLRLKICQIRWIFKTGRTDDRWRGDLQWQILRIFRVSSNDNRTTIAFVYVKEVCRCVVPVWSWISSKYHQRSSLWSIKYFVQILQGSCYLPHLMFIPMESDVFIFSFLRSPSLRYGFMSFWVILTWLQRWWMARLLGYCKWDATFSMLWGGFFDDT